MPYEDDYKMWLEKMLIEMNPDWVCDGMHDKEITRNWCVDYCGEDDEYITPRCLHMYYHHIARADRKTENSSEIPNNCEDLQDWKDRMWAEAIVTEPTISKMEQVEDDQITSKLIDIENSAVSGYESTMSQPKSKLKDEPQTERKER